MNLTVPSAFTSVRPNLASLLLAFAICIGIGTAAEAAPGRFEQRAFNSAIRLYQDELMPQAEKAFAEFLARYPESELRAEAVLRLGQVRLDRKSHV